MDCDCRSYDAGHYRASILSSRSGRFSTVYAVRFLSFGPASRKEQFLALAYSTGLIKLYRLRDAVSQWLGSHEPGLPCIAWQAHAAATTSLSVMHAAGPAGPLLISGGDDGVLRAWSIQSLVAAATPPAVQAAAQGAAAAATYTPGAAAAVAEQAAAAAGAGVKSVWELQLPRAPASWFPAAAGTPGVTCASLDGSSGRLFVGSTDGGVHVVDVARAGSGAGSGAVVHSWAGHLAGVLATDVCPTSHQAASGAEDGIVRVWDVRASTCASAFAPASGTSLTGASQQQQLAASSTSAPVTALRFDAHGSWLVCGQGGASPCITTWSLDAGAQARCVPAPCVVQAMAVQPGEVLVAGTAPTLFRYAFTGQLAGQHDLGEGARSIFSLDLLAAEDTGATDGAAAKGGAGTIAAGAIALGGVGGCVSVLSRYGTQLASLRPLSLED